MAESVMTIAGGAVSGAGTLEVVNPATGRVLAAAPDCSEAQLEQAVAAASEAFPAWRRDGAARVEALIACADAIERDIDGLARLLTLEQGKPIAQARYETGLAAQIFRDNAALPFEDEILREDETSQVVLRRKPLGVVAAITPWNFPLSIAVRKIAPALRAGNTAVLKPSPFTPLASLELGVRLRDALPPGVLNVISGADPLGRWLTEHPAVRKISFTGSVRTGKHILASSVPDLKRVTLELGGNDPAIVLADADPAQIAEKLFWSAFNNCGQVCIAVKRVYVEEALYAPLVSALADVARSVVIGDGLDPATQLGPLNNAAQYDRVIAMIDSVRSEGGTFVCGGQPMDRDGFFVQPSLVTGLGEGTRLVDEEQFGPLLPIIPVPSVEDALERANSTHFGLGGSVWTSDWKRGAQIAGELECGTGWVTQHGVLGFDAPFGGSKQSGIGYENGPWGLAAFTDLQVVNATKI